MGCEELVKQGPRAFTANLTLTIRCGLYSTSLVPQQCTGPWPKSSYKTLFFFFFDNFAFLHKQVHKKDSGDEYERAHGGNTQAVGIYLLLYLEL